MGGSRRQSGMGRVVWGVVGGGGNFNMQHLENFVTKYHLSILMDLMDGL